LEHFQKLIVLSNWPDALTLVSSRNEPESRTRKDKRWALELLGFNSRLTHNRLHPGRCAAAT
jgi:hypothetical protein